MRRSNSLLKNLGKPRITPGGAAAAQFQAAQAPAMDPAAVQHPLYASNPAGYGQGYHPATQPGHVEQAAHGPAELQQARNTLENLIGRLSSLAAAQEGRKQPAPGTGAIGDHLERLTGAVSSMQGEIAGLRTEMPASPADDLKPLIAQLQQDLNAAITGGQIDPAAFGQVVETSHSGVLNEIRAIQASVESSLAASPKLADTIETQYHDLASRLEVLTNSMNADEREVSIPQAGEILDQISKIAQFLAEGQLNTSPDPEVGHRLEEMTAAILAISGDRSNADHLDRIEARVKELARDVETQAGIMQQSGNFSSADLQPLFDQVGTAMAAIDAKLEQFGAPQPGSDDLVAGILALDEKLSALVEREGDHGSLGELVTSIGRLDERMSALTGNEQSSAMHKDLMTGIETVAERLANLSTVVQGGGTPEGTGEGGNALLERLDLLVGRVEDLKGSGHEAGPAQAAVAERLDEVLSRLESGNRGNEGNRVDEALASLEQQVAGIASRLDTSASLDPVIERMESLEQQFGASRDIGIELAAGVAEEAVRKVMAENAGAVAPIDGQLIEGLREDIRHLAQNADTPGQLSDDVIVDIQQTMGNICGRLEVLETGLMEIKALAEEATAEPAAYAEMPAAVPAAPQHSLQEPHYTESAPQAAPEAQLLQEPVENAEFATGYADEQAYADTEIANGAMPYVESEFEPDPTQQDPGGKLSAGEHLVRAARVAEAERQNTLQAEQDFTAPPEPQPVTDPYADAQAAQMAQGLAAEMPETAMNPTETPVGYAAAPPGMDEPIEPGAGEPDLASLVRQANERRKALSERGEVSSGTDFLAAARRAAQAAALEASQAERDAPEPKKPGGILSSIPDMLKRKKTMAVAAAALMLAAVAGPAMEGLEGTPLAGLTQIASLETNEDYLGADGGLDPAAITGGIERTAISDRGSEMMVDLPLKPGPPVARVPDSEPVLFAEELTFVNAALREAALKNDPLALFEIARRYTEGLGVGKDLDKASSIYEAAASRGFVPAQYVIGNFHEKGIGKKADPTMAGAWYEQAADGGHVIAMHNLGVMHASSANGQQDMGKALKWFTMAADHGLMDSQVNLGIFHAKGTAGEVDLVESYKWFAIAGKSGDKDANAKRDLIGNALRPEQLKEARDRVSKWRRIKPDPLANEVKVPDSWNADGNVAVLEDQNVVRKTQELLAKIGLDAGPADGVMGAKTRQAIRDFRSRVGLPEGEQIDRQFIKALTAVSTG